MNLKTPFLGLIIVLFYFDFAFGLNSKTNPSHFDDLVDLYNLKFEKINEFGSFSSLALKGTSSIWILFQPDCANCEAQFKDLSCLPESLSLVALGINGSRDRLSSSLKFTKFKGHKLIATETFAQQIGVPGTPTILIVDKSGHMQKKLIGLKSCIVLKKILNELVLAATQSGMKRQDPIKI